MLARSLRRMMDRLRSTPFHPQWLAYRRDREALQSVHRFSSGIVLDIGCGGRAPQSVLRPECTYVGLDHPTTSTDWYKSTPDLYADAHRLPVGGEAVDTVLLLDVLEHLSRPQRCLAEIARVLAPGGVLLLQVPFLYPLHDEPLDFARWTMHGLHQAVADQGFVVAEADFLGSPLETAALLANIALSKTCLNWLAARSPAALCIIMMPLLVPLINCLALLLGAIGKSDGMMPFGYRIVCRKPECRRS